MLYEKIMNVGFAIRDEKRGCIIIGGIDDKFSLDSLDIAGKINNGKEGVYHMTIQDNVVK